MSEEIEPEGLTLDKRTMDVLVANIIPTSKYFEIRFDHMQSQIDDINYNIKDFRRDVDKRFDENGTDINKRFDEAKTDVNKRFDEAKADVNKRFDEAKTDVNKRFDEAKTDVNKRFEQVDKRFEQVDKRFEQVIASIDRIGDKLDYRDEKQRSFTLRMFTIAIGISILGVLGAFLKSLGVLWEQIPLVTIPRLWPF